MSISRRSLVVSPLALGLAAHGDAAAPSARLAPSLGAAFEGRLAVGAAVRPDQLANPAVAAFIRHHFRVLVAENVMKPATLSRGEGVYDFSGGDAIVAFARAHGMKMRGHTLLWHHQTAAWMFKNSDGSEVTREVLVTRLRRYITDVVTHYRGQVDAWDVVNEAYQFDEGPDAKTDASGLRLSDWRRIIGPDYIEIAFRAAAEADPDALLFYNDYETQNPKKVAAMVAMVKDFKARGIKIDGVGHQSHNARTWPDLKDVEASIAAIAATGVTQHVTELDFALNDTLQAKRVSAATPELLAAQAQRYRDFFALCLRRRRELTAVLTWGVCDADSWLLSWPTPRFEAPLLFDRQLRAKPAYHAVLRVAQEAQPAQPAPAAR